MARAKEPHCPRCSYLLHHVELEQSGFDLCHRCGGKFAPPGALAAHYGDAAHPSSWATTHVATDLGDRKLACPRDGAQLHAFEVAFDGLSVEIDACPTCHGLWLDRGEGDRLNMVLASAETRREIEENDAGGAKAYLFQLFTGLPREVYNPVGKRAVVVLSLVVINALIWVAVVAALADGAIDVSFIKRFGLVSTELTLVGLFAHMFLHSGFMHVFSNLYSLWIFGDNLEDRFGPARFVLLYVVSGLCGAALHVLALPDSPVPVVGASGAIAGVMAAYVVCYPRTKLWMVLMFVRFKLSVWVYMGIWILMQFFGAAAHAPSVAWWVHIGGFGAGALFGLWFKRSEGRWQPMSATTT
jgi:membrane associated rhomboid family serine protease